MSTELKDMLGQEYKVGDKVARALQSGRSINLEILTVTKIDEEKGNVYLNGSKQPVWYPGRMLIVTDLGEKVCGT